MRKLVIGSILAGLLFLPFYLVASVSDCRYNMVPEIGSMVSS